jgi:hypothetical protein
MTELTLSVAQAFSRRANSPTGKAPLVNCFTAASLNFFTTFASNPGLI